MLSRFNGWLGVRFRLHPLFVLLLLLSAATGRFLEILTLFAIVLIHEIGHAAAAKRFGWRLREVLLTPFGGVVATEEEGTVPAREEAVVLLSGPAMNVAMIGFSSAMEWAGIWSYAWSRYFAEANLALLAFNLLPILPLDGGKLMRIVVGYAAPWYKTLKWTAYFSFLASAALTAAGAVRFGTHAFAASAAVIGAFLVYANGYELRMTPYRFFRFLLGRAARVRVWKRTGAKAHVLLVSPEERLSSVARRLLRERLYRFIVATGDGKVLAVVPEERCADRYASGEKDRAVGELFM